MRWLPNAIPGHGSHHDSARCTIGSWAAVRHRPASLIFDRVSQRNHHSRKSWWAKRVKSEMAPHLDIRSSRAVRNYSNKELVWRVLWGFGQLFFRWTPRTSFAWRRFILRCFGAKVGARVRTYPSTRVFFPWNLSIGDWSAVGENVLIYNLGRVAIGQKVTISHGAHLCAGTHDYSQIDFPLLKPPIRIEDQAWICADAFLGPGIVIGEGAVVGARGVVTKDVDSWSMVAGNPARLIGTRVLKIAVLPTLN